METTSLKVVNLLKLDEVTQGPDENPAAFLNRLTEAFTTYTRIAPDSPAGVTTLANRFISQSASDIRKKLSKAEDGPQIPLRDLVKMAFKVYNAREEATKASRKARLKQKAELQVNLLERHTQARVAALQPATGQKVGPQKPPPGAYFKCGHEGHWAHQCPNPRLPTKRCPHYKTARTLGE